MELEEWKQKYGDEKPTKELLETIIKEVDAVIVNNHTKVALTLLSGKCMFELCDGSYEKQLRTVLKSGPFCSICSHFGVDGKKRIKDHRPDVYNSIVQSDVDKDLLINSSVKKLRHLIIICHYHQNLIIPRHQRMENDIVSIVVNGKRRKKWHIKKRVNVKYAERIIVMNKDQRSMDVSIIYSRQHNMAINKGN